MDCSWLESTAFDRRKAADELLRGREFAQQLRAHLRRRSVCGRTASEDLVSQILNSFNKTLSILNPSSDSDINSSIVDSADKATKVEASGDSCKSSSTPNDRRGCNKRSLKKSHSLARESASLVEDGHAWRKYGQKWIQNTKFPRNYYRCTHKYDQSCQATKQVQQVEQHPQKFHTTYHGHHTCTNFLKPFEIVLGSPSFHDSDGILLSFDSPDAQDSDRDRFLFPAEKEQLRKEELVATKVCSPDLYMSAGPSPDHFSQVMMIGPVVDFEDDDLQFHF